MNNHEQRITSAETLCRGLVSVVIRKGAQYDGSGSVTLPSELFSPGLSCVRMSLLAHDCLVAELGFEVLIKQIDDILNYLKNTEKLSYFKAGLGVDEWELHYQPEPRRGKPYVEIWAKLRKTKHGTHAWFWMM